MNRSTPGPTAAGRSAALPFVLAVALLPFACGPAATEPREPTPETQPDAAGTGSSADVGAAVAEAGTTEVAQQPVGPLPGPPGADPPGFEVFEPLPEGLALTRALWKVEGALAADALRDGVGKALAAVDTCLAEAVPGGRLPLHIILEASGRVVEVGAPLADAGLRSAITCAQESLRMLRFPEASGETTVRLIVER